MVINDWVNVNCDRVCFILLFIQLFMQLDLVCIRVLD